MFKAIIEFIKVDILGIYSPSKHSLGIPQSRKEKRAAKKIKKICPKRVNDNKSCMVE